MPKIGDAEKRSRTFLGESKDSPALKNVEHPKD
jgi:hypothetical protein